MKKLLLSLGTIAAVATPIIAVVSCGGSDKPNSNSDETKNKTGDKTNTETKNTGPSSDDKSTNQNTTVQTTSTTVATPAHPMAEVIEALSVDKMKGIIYILGDKAIWEAVHAEKVEDLIGAFLKLGIQENGPIKSKITDGTMTDENIKEVKEAIKEADGFVSKMMEHAPELAPTLDPNFKFDTVALDKMLQDNFNKAIQPLVDQMDGKKIWTAPRIKKDVEAGGQFDGMDWDTVIKGTHWHSADLKDNLGQGDINLASFVRVVTTNAVASDSEKGWLTNTIPYTVKPDHTVKPGYKTGIIQLGGLDIELTAEVTKIDGTDQNAAATYVIHLKNGSSTKDVTFESVYAPKNATSSTPGTSLAPLTDAEYQTMLDSISASDIVASPLLKGTKPLENYAKKSDFTFKTPLTNGLVFSSVSLKSSNIGEKEATYTLHFAAGPKLTKDIDVVVEHASEREIPVFLDIKTVGNDIISKIITLDDASTKSDVLAVDGLTDSDKTVIEKIFETTNDFKLIKAEIKFAFETTKQSNIIGTEISGQKTGTYTAWDSKGTFSNETGILDPIKATTQFMNLRLIEPKKIIEGIATKAIGVDNFLAGIVNQAYFADGTAKTITPVTGPWDIVMNAMGGEDTVKIIMSATDWKLV